MSTTTDVIIIGAGAAGLFCAARTAAEGRTVKVLDHANKAGKKILMSGGGRCNFTNYYIEPACYLSQNPHFCKSALSRYTQWDFIDLVSKYDIPFHEKKDVHLPFTYDLHLIKNKGIQGQMKLKHTAIPA